MVWADWIERVEATALAERQAALVDAARSFGRRDEYDYSPAAMAAMRPGRRRLLQFMRCAGKMMAKMALPPERGGKGTRRRKSGFISRKSQASASRTNSNASSM